MGVCMGHVCMRILFKSLLLYSLSLEVSSTLFMHGDLVETEIKLCGSMYNQWIELITNCIAHPTRNRILIFVPLHFEAFLLNLTLFVVATS